VTESPGLRALRPASESALIKNTLGKDPTHSEEEALKQIYSLLRPGDAPNKETARQALDRLFFSPKALRSRAGWTLQDQPAAGAQPASQRDVLTREDFVAIIRYLVELHEGRGHTDDIDHLGQPAASGPVGELIANQSRSG